MFSLIRGVLLRPLVNRDENRLIYIRESAPSSRRAGSPSRPSGRHRFTTTFWTCGT
jgi:hypothetical protein